MRALDKATIYVLIDPRTEEIRYVGWTAHEEITERLLTHLRQLRGKSHRVNWLRKLTYQGYVPRIEPIQTVPSWCWPDAERYWIAYYRAMGCPLVNGTDGGEGTLGQKHRSESKAKMSAAQKGRKNANPHRWTPEEEVLQSERTRKQFENLEARAAVSRVHKGKTISDAHKAAVSGAQKARWEKWRKEVGKMPPEYGQAISAAKKGSQREGALCRIHGNYSCYVISRCRCDLCREAARAYNRGLRERKRLQGLSVDERKTA